MDQGQALPSNSLSVPAGLPSATTETCYLHFSDSQQARRKAEARSPVGRSHVLREGCEGRRVSRRRKGDRRWQHQVVVAAMVVGNVRVIVRVLVVVAGTRWAEQGHQWYPTVCCWDPQRQSGVGSAALIASKRPAMVPQTSVRMNTRRLVLRLGWRKGRPCWSWGVCMCARG